MDLTHYFTTGYATATTEQGGKPEIGQVAPAQQTGNDVAFGFGAIAGYSACPAFSLAVAREMMDDPTIAIGMETITAPILAASWKYVAKEDAPDEAVELIRETFEPQRVDILRDAIRSVWMGWYPFEKVWGPRDSRIAITLRGLLPELCRVMVDKQTKMLAGVLAGDVELNLLKSWLITYDREGDNFYGRSRFRNIINAWHEWNEIAKKAGQLATKAAAIIPIVHYPAGVGQDAQGASRSNAEMMSMILTQLQSARGIGLPNLAGDPGQLMANPELAGKSSWVISFLEAAGAAQSLSGLTDRQRYLDSLKLRGLFVPERVVTEGQFGTKAEAETHTDSMILSCERLHADIVRSLNRDGGVRDVLVANFGERAREWVEVQPSPLDDKKRAIFKQIFSAVLAMPYASEDLITQIDFDAVAEGLGIPKLNKEQSISLAAVVKPPTDSQGNPMPVDPNNPNAQATNPKAEAVANDIENRLNGAQITAAVDLLVQLRQGIITPNAAIELLIALGIEDATARKMVAEIQRAGPLETEDDKPSDDSQNSNSDR